MIRNQENNNVSSSKNSVNAFAFMMKNRHKQDELIKEITEKPNDALTEEEISDTDVSLCSIGNKLNGKNSALPKINCDKVNAFQFLMCNRVKDKLSEEEDDLSYDSSPLVKKKKKNKNVKGKIRHKKIINSSSDDSDDDASNNDQDLKAESRLSRNRILISPSDSKSKLINENEYFDLEETFKDEIKECFSAKKKKKKIKQKQKTKSNSDNPLQYLQRDHTTENENEPLDKNNEVKLLKESITQPGIKIFFKPSGDNEQKENIILNSKPCIIQNIEIMKVFNNVEESELINKTPMPTLMNCNSKISSENLKQKNIKKLVNTYKVIEKGNDQLSILKEKNDQPILKEKNARPTCLKEKTKALRKIRISKSESNKKVKNSKKQSNGEYINNNDSNSDFKNDIEKDQKFKGSAQSNSESHFQKNSSKTDVKDDKDLDYGLETKKNLKVKQPFLSSKKISESQSPIETCESSKFDDSGSDFKQDTTRSLKQASQKNSKSKSHSQNNSDDSNQDAEMNDSISEFKTDKDCSLSLRRSSRTIKKPKTYEIFDTSIENEVKEKKRKVKKKLDLDPDNNKKSSKKKLVLDENHSQATKKKRFRSKKNNASSANEINHKKERILKRSVTEKQNEDNDTFTEPDIIVLDSPDNIAEKKVSLLAPIFMKKKKITISPTKLKARAEFLFSDVPENLKKFSLKCIEEQQNLICPFPKYSHIKQNDEKELYWNLAEPDVLLLKKNTEPLTSHEFEQTFKILSRKANHSSSREPLTSFPLLNSSTVCHILAYLKSKIETFPVVSVYNSFIQSKKEHIQFYEKEYAKEALKRDVDNKSNLVQENKKAKRKRKSRIANRNKRRKITEDSLMECEEAEEEEPLWHKWVPYEWTQVFSPKSAEHVIGNLGPISKLKEFLTKWKSALKSDNNWTNNSVQNMSDDSCDTYSEKASVINTMLITGPSGIGKTASVYAVAQDLGYNVLEINASSSRQGKELMSQLSEATQSHNVSTVGSNQTVSVLPNQVTTITLDISSDKGKSMSLILIEDIDIVFEDYDEGFWSAVNTLLCTSKRPIIMTSSSDATYPIPKVKGEYEDVEFFSPNPEHTAQYLQILCLANGVFTCLKEIELLVKSNNNDIRKSIVDLQFWILSGKCNVQWWKVDNELNMSNALKPQRNGEMNLLDIFPSIPKLSCKSVEIPICMGSIWSKSDATSLKNPEYLSDEKEYLNWTLMSVNCEIVLPFMKKEKERRKLKYPLCRDDPDLKKHSLWQKHSWLSLDDESDSEKEAVKVIDIKNTDENLPQYPPHLKKCIYLCVNKLNGFLSSFADLDILSYSSHLSQREYPHEFHRNWWTPSMLDGLEANRNSISLPYCDLNSNLIPELSHLNLSITQKGIMKATQSLKTSEEILPLCLTQGSSLIMSPHCRLPVRKRKVLEELHQSLNVELSSQNQLNRYSVVMDYLPALRDIARSDHVGEAIQQFKRSRRILKYFDHLQIDSLSKTNLIDLCNLFQSEVE